MRSINTIADQKSRLCETLFCLALFAVFLPFKIYPLVFLLAALFFAWDTPVWLRHHWVVFLAVFSTYALFVFLAGLPADRSEVTNFIKLPVNFGFLYFAVSWLAQRDNGRLLRWVDIVLHIVLGLTLLQLLIYHQAVEFRWIGGASGSAQGSALYLRDLYFWGLDDKNMFGARIALVGFAFVLVPIVRQQTVTWWRIVLVLVLAWLSLSRTPVVALLLGIYCLLWAASTTRWRVVLGLAAVLALPVIAQKVVRVENITASNDGMGVRMVYWRAFFEHFDSIPLWGNGFMSGGEFMARYAGFYHGEPHIHNTFLSCYLDFGIIGLGTYVLFLFYFYRFCCRYQPARIFWLLALAPLLAIMMILYSGYDNDIVLYLALVFLLGSSRPVMLKSLKWRAF